MKTQTNLKEVSKDHDLYRLDFILLKKVLTQLYIIFKYKTQHFEYNLCII